MTAVQAAALAPPPTRTRAPVRLFGHELPRGAERLYEDLRFWTGIDECESYGVDFLTGNKNTRSDYARIDPKGKAFLKPVQWRRQPNPASEAYPFTLITGRVVYHFHTRTKTGRSMAPSGARSTSRSNSLRPAGERRRPAFRCRGVLGMWAHQPWLFPSLGPTIFLQTVTPNESAARPWNTVRGHGVGIAAG